MTITTGVILMLAHLLQGCCYNSSHAVAPDHELTAMRPVDAIQALAALPSQPSLSGMAASLTVHAGEGKQRQRSKGRRTNWLWFHSNRAYQPLDGEIFTHGCSGSLEGEWQDDMEWQILDDKCKTVDLQEDAEGLMSCLDEKTIAFVGDSHVRNAFRCVADLLTGGSSAHALPHYGEAWNDPEEPSDWPKYYHLDMISVDPAEESKRGRHSNEVPDALLTGTTQLHTLSCENHVKVHRHDYSFTAKGPHGTSVKLEFFWQPWGGSKPLLESQDVVEQMGLESAVYRFNYTGSRARTKFIPELKRRKPLDLVVTGGEARDHTALFESFAGSAILLNHAGNHDNLEEAAAQHGIPVADVTSALLSREPDFYSSRDPGTHGVPRVKHPPAEVLRAQAKLILTLAVNQLCPSRPPA